MPRLRPSLLVRARNISPLLPILLRTCRTLPSARNELRWLHEHVTSESRVKHEDESRALLLQLCLRRGRGVPLQYLLGSQPFGELDILCRPGVLIPRPETEAYTNHLASLILQDAALKGKDPLKILDLCTGTGCIPLSLYQQLHIHFPHLQVHGVDISPKALNLANDNLKHNITKSHLPATAKQHISFNKADVLSQSWQNADSQHPSTQEYDIVISNPPYISAAGFKHDTTRSVRNYEPALALVPPVLPPQVTSIPGTNAGVLPEDVFYPRILAAARNAGAHVVLMEVADTKQALRVARLAIAVGKWRVLEIWRDWPDVASSPDEMREVEVEGRKVLFKGNGHGRAVVCWR